MPYLDLARAVAAEPDVEAACLEVLRSGCFVLGPAVAAFEAAFASYCSVEHAVGVGNGLDALVMVLRAWGVGPGDDVLVPSNTYIATWLAVSAVGARPVPVEPDPDRALVDGAGFAAVVTPATRAVVGVHLYGRSADLSGLADCRRRRGVLVLEDAAQAHGSSCAGVSAGGLGDAAAWSFYPTKNLGALGDGGAVTTDDERLADSLRLDRNYGSRRKYHNEVRGRNSRLDEMQAAVLLARLARLDAANGRRRTLAGLYAEALADVPGLVVPELRDGDVAHVFELRHDRRDALASALAARGIGTQVFYPVPPHLSPAYADLGLRVGDLPVAERLARTTLALPIAPYLTEGEVHYVAGTVRAVCVELASSPTAA